jgi:hypothetical protein
MPGRFGQPRFSEKARRRLGAGPVCVLNIFEKQAESSKPVSPWCDEDIMARELGKDYVYSRKPSPLPFSGFDFGEELIRAGLRKTLKTALGAGCRLEIIMKDVHTLNSQPWRLPRWVQIAREELSAVS